MTVHIRVYLFSDTIKYLLANDCKMINDISKDTNTKINNVTKKMNSFFIIQGSVENSHKARIILQDIEKELYRDAYYNIDNK